VRRNILVADDDKITQTLVQSYLEQAGFVVTICKDGFSALDELNSNHYDLIILDISMPHINGIRALRSIRGNEKTKDIPIIMLTGSRDKNDLRRARDFSVNDYVIKPPTRENLLSRVELAIGGIPQLEELMFTENDSEVNGGLSLPTRVKSISNGGMILIGSVPIEKDHKIKISEVKMLTNLKISTNEFKIKFCNKNEDEQFEYYLSFIGLPQKDQESIRQWITTESYRRKASA
jgi:CheY-like chemotaxis protein